MFPFNIIGTEGS